MNPILAYVLVAVVNGPLGTLNGSSVSLTPTIVIEHFASYEGCQRAAKALVSLSERMVYTKCLVDQADLPEGRTRLSLPKAE